MKAFLIGLQFLTRLKLVEQTKWEMEDFGRSVLYFPLVGLVIGLFMAIIWLVGYQYIDSLLLTLLLVIFEFLFTGGLHADGFMDTCDGLFSGRDRERKLAIMKDSRVGSNGVVGFVFLTLLKWQFLFHIPPAFMTDVLLMIPILSRYGMTLSITAFPYARPEGMGKVFAGYAPARTPQITTCLAFLPVFVLGWHYLIYLGFTVLLTLLLNSYCTKHLGGVTGDTYGFVCESTELLLLLIMVLTIGRL